MADNVKPIRPGAYDPDMIPPDVVIPPDQVLDALKGNCERLAVVYLDHAGNLFVSGSHAAPEGHLLLHMGMLELVKSMTGGGLGGTPDQLA